MRSEITNFGYLEEVLGIRAAADPEYFEHCINVMRAYEKNHDAWWLSSDPIELTKRQVDESILLIPYDVLESTFTKVLGRRIRKGEVSFSNKELIAEFKEKVETFSAVPVMA